jgi:hypothetical protein
MKESYKSLDLGFSEMIDGREVPTSRKTPPSHHDEPVVERTPEQRAATRQAIKDLGKLAADDPEILNFLPILRELNAFKPMIAGKTQRVMAQVFGDIPAARHLADIKQCKSLAEVKSDLLSLSGDQINFNEVGHILMTRWNRNFYKLLNDSMIASLTNVLAEQNPALGILKREHRVETLLLEIQKQADLRDRPLSGPVHVPLDARPVAKVIPLKVEMKKAAPDQYKYRPAQETTVKSASEIFRKRYLEASSFKAITDKMVTEGVHCVGREWKHTKTDGLNFPQVLDHLSKLKLIDFYQVARIIFQWKPSRRFRPENIESVVVKLKKGNIASVRDLLRAVIPEA